MDIAQLRVQIEAARERARASSANQAEVKRLMRELGLAIAAGAVPCPTCGAHPHGIEQPQRIGRQVVQYEIGCLACPARVRAKTQQQAVLLWNAGAYD
jgi:hypothetical protein